MKILILSRYGEQGASSRMRFTQFFDLLRLEGIEYVFSPLFSDEMLVRKYAKGSYGIYDLFSAYFYRFLMLLKKSDFDFIWIEKEAFPWLPFWFEYFLLSKSTYVLDFDDAIFHNYDLNSNKLVVALFGRRIDHLMNKSSLIFSGNKYLSDRALLAGATNIVKIPTSVDINRYICKDYNVEQVERKLVIVWIGSPSTSKYLKIVSEALIMLSAVIPFKLRVIGDNFNIDGVDVESLTWALTTEAELIRDADVGIMPLENTPWDQGKCAYKLIQYMASGLPTVSSPVGANLDVVIDNETGLFARNTNDWFNALLTLFNDEKLRCRFGLAGRQRIESEFCLQVIGPKIISAFSSLKEC